MGSGSGTAARGRAGRSSPTDKRKAFQREEVACGRVWGVREDSLLRGRKRFGLAGEQIRWDIWE